MRYGKLGTWLLFAVAVPFALYSNLSFVKQETRALERLERGGHFQDGLLYEPRLQPLREFLPRDSVVGYVTDDSVDAGFRTGNYFFVQYVLCPVLVAEGKDYPYVIGNYYGLDNPRTTETADLEPVKDFGYGIGLYRGKEK